MEEIKEDDYICPICLELLVEPCSIPCNHSFCELCIKELINMGGDKLICPMDRKSFEKNQFQKNKVI